MGCNCPNSTDHVLPWYKARVDKLTRALIKTERYLATLPPDKERGQLIAYLDDLHLEADGHSPVN